MCSALLALRHVVFMRASSLHSSISRNEKGVFFLWQLSLFARYIVFTSCQSDSSNKR